MVKTLQPVGPLYRCIMLCVCVMGYRNNHEGVLDTGSNFWISANQMVRRIKCMGEGGREGGESVKERGKRERERERERERDGGEIKVGGDDAME